MFILQYFMGLEFSTFEVCISSGLYKFKINSFEEVNVSLEQLCVTISQHEKVERFIG